MAIEKITSHITLQGNFNKEKVWNIITDFERYPDIMENVDSVQIHEKNDSTGRTVWHITVEEAPLKWIENDFYFRDAYELRFKSIEGDFDLFDGCWKINDTADGIEIIFIIEYSLGIPVLEEVLGPILKEKMKNNMDTMLNAIKEQVR